LGSIPSRRLINYLLVKIDFEGPKFMMKKDQGNKKKPHKILTFQYLALMHSQLLEGLKCESK
jgi:hypothetical protein